MSPPLEPEVQKLKVLTQSCILWSEISCNNVPIYLFMYNIFGDDIVAIYLISVANFTFKIIHFIPLFSILHKLTYSYYRF